MARESGNAVALQGLPISPTAPTDGQALVRDPLLMEYVPTDVANGNAEENVQSDRNEADNTADEFILNKPTTITTAQATAITANTAKNSYPNADATKLGTIETGAEVNVQSDWGQTDNTADDFIKNKPTIPTVPTNVSAFTNDAGYQNATQVNTAIQAVVDAAPGALDTLNELAASLGDDANFAGTMTTALAGKVDKTTTINGTLSVTGGGDLTANRTFQLVNDLLAPGNSFYYGTDGAGVKGYHALPAGNVTTNLTVVNRNATTLDVASSDGVDATIPQATTTLSGLMSGADKAKLDLLTDQIEWLANLGAFPVTGDTNNVLYGAIDTGIMYRWDGTAYQAVSGDTNIYTQSGTFTGSHVGTLDGNNYTFQGSIGKVKIEANGNTYIGNTAETRGLYVDGVNANPRMRLIDTAGGGRDFEFIHTGAVSFIDANQLRVRTNGSQLYFIDIDNDNLDTATATQYFNWSTNNSGLGGSERPLMRLYETGQLKVSTAIGNTQSITPTGEFARLYTQLGAVVFDNLDQEDSEFMWIGVEPGARVSYIQKTHNGVLRMVKNQIHPTYANDATAALGGLVEGDHYQSPDGAGGFNLKVKA